MAETPSLAEIIVGIDLGTTFSAIAYVNENKVPTLIQVEHKATLPSVVLFPDVEADGVRVGDSALSQVLIRPERTVRWIKRSMGEAYVRTIPYRDPEYPDKTYTKEYTAEEISAEILKKLVAEAQAELGQPIRKAIITCPAWFDDKARKATQKAGELAGLEVLQIVNEPTAAAVFYGLAHLKEGETMLVYDLGGGTFDASILRNSGGRFDHLMSVGDRKLGGHEWTQVLLKKVAERLTEQFNADPTLDPLVRQNLYELCEQAKRDLAKMPSVTIPCVLDGRMADVTVTQEEFEDWTERFVEDTLHWSDEAVRKAGLTWNDINHVLLVGGSTRLRRVPKALAQMAGKAPIATGQEDTMVALGAAVLTVKEVRSAGARSPVRRIDNLLKERTHRALGFVTAGKTAERRFENAVVIKAQTELPAQETRSDLRTLVPNQEYFDVAVLEGDNVDAKRNTLNATYRFRCPPGAPKGTQIKVTFAYDKSNTIKVTARDVRSNAELLFTRQNDFQWPEGGGKRHVDIGFVVDCTGSMQGCISGVKHEIGNFCNDLATSDVDYRLSLVEYRDLKIDEQSRTYDWTADVAQFRDWVAALKAHGGGDEPESALDALATAAELQPRPGAAHVLVLITDASAHVPDQRGRDASAIAALLKEGGAKVFAIAPDNAAYRTIVERTEGKLFDFDDKFVVGSVDVSLFGDVLRDLGSAVIDSLLEAES